MADHGVWRSDSLLARLAPNILTELLELGSLKAYPSGSVLIREGSTDTHAIVLLQGFVKITVASSDGDTLVAVRAAGDIVGELAATGGRRRLATVTAWGDVSTRVIVADVFRQFLKKFPDASSEITTMVGERLAFANRRRVDFATLPVLTRLARVLVELAALCGERQANGIVQIPTPLRQAELADLVGSSEDTMQRALSRLKREGLIETAYASVTLRDMSRLRALAGDADHFSLA